MDTYCREPSEINLKRLPNEDGRKCYQVICSTYSFIGYVYSSLFNNKWAAFSQYGQAMTDHIYKTPMEAAKFTKV